MITPKVNGTKVIFGPCRLSYTYVFAKYNPKGNAADGKYQTKVLIPKSEKETVKALREAIEAAKRAGVVSKWGGEKPKKLALPLNDGDVKDGDNKDGELCEGHFFVNAKCNDRPGILDRNRQPIVDEEEMYSGVWALVSVTFFPYDANGNKGVACGLNNLMKWKDDDHLGGRVSAEADFGDVDTSGEDEEDL